MSGHQSSKKDSGSNPKMWWISLATTALQPEVVQLQRDRLRVGRADRRTQEPGGRLRGSLDECSMDAVVGMESTDRGVVKRNLEVATTITILSSRTPRTILRIS
jgi:hypothetical protein